MNVLASLISFVLLSSIGLACSSTIHESLQSLESLHADSRGDSSPWIDGKYCYSESTDPDAEDPFILYKEDFFNQAANLETAKKECADGCDANEDCKYAEIFWLPGEAQMCTFLTKDLCVEMKSDDKSYTYKKQ